MRILIQRVLSAAVHEQQTLLGQIDKGMLLFVGFRQGDDAAALPGMVQKILHLRIFADEQGKTNCSVLDIQGDILAVPQFTLYADCRHGRRPGFSYAAPPALAEALYLAFIALCQTSRLQIAQGRFAADMKVTLCNDGPFTVLLDSDDC
jgi:D-aminoacyl-tRNA deacylase